MADSIPNAPISADVTDSTGITNTPVADQLAPTTASSVAVQPVSPPGQAQPAQQAQSITQGTTVNPVTPMPASVAATTIVTPIPTAASVGPVSTRTAPLPRWTIGHSLGVLATLLATGVASWFIPSRFTTWLVTIGLLTLFMAITSNGTTGYWRGALIDDRNTISLSRLQMAVWTILILSALLTAGVTNIRIDPLALTGHFGPDGSLTALGITIPANILLLMGIATTSLVATPLILNTKTAKPANDDQKQATLDQMARQRLDVNTIVNNGQLLANTTPQNARWADLFTGEEVGNAAQFDLGKIQLFYFTFILALVYAIALGTLFASSTAQLKAFPDVDAGMLALLGISHAGYLVNKAVPHSAVSNS